jgi:hypothetical protein
VNTTTQKLVHYIYVIPCCALRRWALIRDEKVAKRALSYVEQSIMGASRDTQLRMLKILKVILANLHGKEDIFAFGYDVMSSRWRRLNAVVSRSTRISLQKMPPQYCTYFNRIKEPSPGDQFVSLANTQNQFLSTKIFVLMCWLVWSPPDGQPTRG